MTHKQSSTDSGRPQHAFEIYNSLGGKRTYQAVATQLGVSVRTVRHWAKAHNWRGRIAEREAALARRLADESMVNGAAESERNLKIVRAALLRLAKGIADGKIKMQMGDLDRLIRLEEHLTGYPKGPDSDGKYRGGQVVVYLPAKEGTIDDGSLPTADELGLHERWRKQREGTSEPGVPSAGERH